MVMVEARRVEKVYSIGGRQVRVLHNVSLSVQKGEFMIVRGSSGSGKTTLLSVLSGLDKPSDGRVILNGQEITHAPEDDLADLRNTTIGFVFQSFHLVPSLTAMENIMFPAELKRDGLAAEKAETLMKKVGMLHRKDSYPHQLSGGEKQRTAICRALINEPAVIFADEPTGNLDSKSGDTILKLLTEFHRERQTTLVMVTHNEAIADLADSVMALSDGRIFPETVDAA